MTPKISIAIPAYIKNDIGISYLKESFYRIQNQSVKNYEVVVTDNSPNDLVEKLCFEYKDSFNLRYYRNTEQIGMSSNSNCVMNLCNGEYIKILHCDDLLYTNNALEIIIKNIESSQKYWLVNGFNHTHDGLNFFDSRFPTYPTHLLIGNNLLGCPSNITIKNNDLEYFDENLSISMDHEWYHRIRMKHGMPVIIQDVLTTSRIHTDNTTSKLKLDIVLEADDTAWEFMKTELEYLENKHKTFFEMWKYPDEN